LLRRPEFWFRAVLTLAGLHSLVLGTAMLFSPRIVLGQLGWNSTASEFFPAQSGLFLVILGGVYLAALAHRPFAWVLVGSKAAAVVFLVAETVAGHCPAWMLVVAGLDGTMGVAAAAALLALRRSNPLMRTRHGHDGHSTGSPRRSTRPSIPLTPE
jgi:hypothetical protein